MNGRQNCSACFLSVCLGSQHRKLWKVRSRNLSSFEEPVSPEHAQLKERHEKVGEETLTLPAEDVLAGKKCSPWPQLSWWRDGWSEGAAWAMKTGTNMKIAGKTVYVFVLLTVTMVMRLAGESNWTNWPLGSKNGKCAQLLSLWKL